MHTVGRIEFGPERAVRILPFDTPPTAPFTALIPVGQYLCRSCPHCGGTDLMHNFWSLDDEEIDAVECVECSAGAPATVWNRRA